MSAEGKLKRGVSGFKNAQSIPFRYGGNPCNLDTTIRTSSHPTGAGAKLVRAMELAHHLETARAFGVSQRLGNMTEAALTRIERGGYKVAPPPRRTVEFECEFSLSPTPEVETGSPPRDRLKELKILRDQNLR